MKKLFYLLSLFAILVFQNSLSAQVTIGADIVPNSGALLDLKEYTPADPLVDNSNSTKGILFPRVSLLSQTDLTASLGSTVPLDATAHVGLFLYNTNETVTLCPNLHVWNGTQWEELNRIVLETVSDEEGNSYYARQFGPAGTWMIQNLRSRHYAASQGGAVLQQFNLSGNASSRFFGFPGDATGAILNANPDYGLLYTWQTATNRNVGGGAANGNNPSEPLVQGICPDGWHVPTDYEWSVLEEEIANNTTGEYVSDGYIATPWNPNWADNTLGTGFRGTHGRSMQSWRSVELVGAGNASGKALCNGAGINLLPMGLYASFDLTNFDFYAQSYTWASSDSRADGLEAWYRWVTPGNAGVSRLTGDIGTLLPVRCKKN